MKRDIIPQSVRLIDANALLRPDEKSDSALIFGGGRAGGKTIAMAMELVKQKIKNAPTIDPESLRPHGRWKLHDDGSGTCDQCNFTQKNVWDYDSWQNYCGVCGADMRERQGAISNMSPATKKLYDDVMESLTREDGDNNA